MRVVFFCRSLVSDRDQGSARFLRGVATELNARGHEAALVESGTLAEPELEQALAGADLVLVHHSTDPGLVARVASQRARSGDYRLLFHDTHPRAVTAPEEMRRFDLSGFDGVLAFGEVIRQAYLERGWAARAWTWHEAADTRVFAPRPGTTRIDDLVWIGDWGSGERAMELRQMLLEPARHQELTGVIHGPRFPLRARLEIRRSGLRYGGRLADHLMPAVFARHRFTIDAPPRAYARALPGVPTVRMFEALACGIPLICTDWDDAEGLFTPDRDYLPAHDQRDMESAMRTLTKDRARAAALGEHGLATILARHTCAHRVNELLSIDASLRGDSAPAAAALG